MQDNTQSSSYQQLEQKSKYTNMFLRWFLYFVLILFASLIPTLSFQLAKAAFSSSDLVALKIVVTLGNLLSPNKYFLYPSSIDLEDFG